MTKHLLDLLEFLEHDLADTYQYLKVRSKISHLSSLYDYMVEHSREHASQIKGKQASLPNMEFDDSTIMLFQKNLKQMLVEYLVDRADDVAVVTKMVDTERLLGDLYGSLSKRFQTIGQAYNGLADTMDRLARDEDDHRKRILKELESLKLIRDALGPREE